MANLFAVTGLLIEEDQVLAVSRKTDPNDFGLPGGKIDPGETPEAALVREIREETGLEVVAFEKIFEDRDRVFGGELRPCRTYLIFAWTGDLSSTEKGVVKWVKPSVVTDPKSSFQEYNSKLFSSLPESLRSVLKLV
jgi:8-oxo-dGTP diphosphatase